MSTTKMNTDNESLSIHKCKYNVCDHKQVNFEVFETLKFKLLFPIP